MVLSSTPFSDHNEWKRRLLGTLGNEALTLQSLLDRMRLAWPDYSSIYYNVHMMSLILQCRVRIVYAKVEGEDAAFVVVWSD